MSEATTYRSQHIAQQDSAGSRSIMFTESARLAVFGAGGFLKTELLTIGPGGPTIGRVASTGHEIDLQDAETVTFLVWLPPRGQVVSLLRVHDRVRSCVRPLNAAFPLPRAGMVICGLGPNLRTELLRSEEGPGFPKPDLFDHCAHSGRRLLTLVSSPAVAAGRYRHAGATVAGSM